MSAVPSSAGAPSLVTGSSHPSPLSGFQFIGLAAASGQPSPVPVGGNSTSPGAAAGAGAGAGAAAGAGVGAQVSASPVAVSVAVPPPLLTEEERAFNRGVFTPACLALHGRLAKPERFTKFCPPVDFGSRAQGASYHHMIPLFTLVELWSDLRGEHASRTGSCPKYLKIAVLSLVQLSAVLCDKPHDLIKVLHVREGGKVFEPTTEFLKEFQKKTLF